MLTHHNYDTNIAPPSAPLPCMWQHDVNAICFLAHMFITSALQEMFSGAAQELPISVTLDGPPNTLP